MTGRRLLAAGIALAALVGPAASAAAIPAKGPVAQITDVQTASGKLSFTFSAQNLPAGAHLDPASVHVTANGQPLPATAQLTSGPSGEPSAPAALPVRAAELVLDLSGSMAGAHLAAARQAALAYAAALPVDVRVGLITFADTAQQVLAPTADRRALAAALSRVQTKGDTALYDAIVTAVQAMQTLPANAARRLLIISDGADTASHATLGTVLALLRQAHVGVDVVGFGLSAADQAVLAQIAAAGGGRALPASGAGDLAGVFAAARRFSERAAVNVSVPKALAGKSVSLSVSMAAGGHPITTATTVRLAGVPIAPAAPTAPAAPKPSASAPAHGSPMLWLVLALTFCGILGVTLLAMWRPRGADARARRLAQVQRYRVSGLAARGLAEDANPSAVAQAALSAIDRVVRSRGLRERIAANLERAAIRMRPQEWVLLQACLGVVLAAVFTLLTGSLPIAIVIGFLLGWLGPRSYLQLRGARRVAKFGEQLPDVLQLVASSLRAGFSLNQALDGVVREGTDPAATEFARALAEARLGANLEDGLDDVAERMRCRDLAWVVMAIRISREVGGNLAEVLMTTVATMRERAQMRRQVRALSAEGRLSAWILICLPIFVASWLLLVRRAYLRPLYTTPIGLGMLAFAGAMLVVGAFWMSRVVKVEV